MHLLLLWIVFGTDVRNLAAEDFAIRERAEARLTTWAPLAWRLCDGSFQDLEQRRRARRVVNCYVGDNWAPLVFRLRMLYASHQMYYWRDDDGGGYNTKELRPPHAGAWLESTTLGRQEPLFWFAAFWLHKVSFEVNSNARWYSMRGQREATRDFAIFLLRMGVPLPAVKFWLAE